MRYVMAVLVAAAVAVALALFLVVDDWRRDFTVNVAETDPHAADATLRPIVTSVQTDEILDALRRTTGRFAHWTWAAELQDDSGVTVRLVRTTKLLRFKDDVTVRIADGGSERVVSAVSRSRVGNADLGQNPRNIRELFRHLRSQLPAPASKAGVRPIA